MPKSRKILVVDDESEIVSLLVRFLTREGYEVSTAMNVKEALPIYLEYAPFDVLLYDVWLGEKEGSNGWGVAEKIRALQPDIRVLMFTGRIALDVPDAVGQHTLIAKPFTPESLRETLASLW